MDLQNSDAWKIQLTIVIKIISSKDVAEERVMHLISGRIKFTSYSDANKFVDKLFKSLRSRYHENLETSMKGSDFVFFLIQFNWCLTSAIFKRGGSYIDSLDSIKNKKATINLKKTDDKCFQCTPTVALNFIENELHPERVYK